LSKRRPEIQQFIWLEEEDASITAHRINAGLIRRQLEEKCGYSPDLIKENFAFSSGGDAKTISLAAFAHLPIDARSACIAYDDKTDGAGEVVASYRDLGAPIVFLRQNGSLQWWAQRNDGPVCEEVTPFSGLDKFFSQRREDFSPESIYRAKTLGRLDKSFQLSFVDLGLMPVIEERIGKELSSLIERLIFDLKGELDWKNINRERGQWLIKSTFWLLAAKILHDKQVKNFRVIDLFNFDEIFGRVARHYGFSASDQVAVIKSRRKALENVAHEIDRYAPLSHVTTEALGEVYESALINKATRQKLGTHSTPSYLVDYIVWRLEPWIREIDLKDRVVFEPACGHSAFLISAMRLLRRLASAEINDARMSGYLRERLWGIELDYFALEIARLSLTLADIPNPNGWKLSQGDMFIGNELEERAKKSMVLLANPPFENFKDREKKKLAQHGGTRPELKNKTAEMLRRALPVLPNGALVGVVVPQGFLHGAHAKSVRQIFRYGIRCPVGAPRQE